MGERKKISKKLRFEIFKRDLFTCQYCGATPPKAILEIDHIDPISKGGDNYPINLITACFSCNRGKSNIALGIVLPATDDNIELIKIKEKQLKEFRKFITAVRKREKRDINKVAKIYSDYFPGQILSDKFKKISIGTFLKKLPPHTVEDAMEKAVCCMDNKDDAVKYFCGICWREIKK